MPAPVAVVVVSYRTPELLLRCLAPLTEDPDLEVVVVDNASGDGSVAAVRQRHPDVTVIENRCNLGFPAAVNQGVAATTAAHVMVLNADVLLSVGAVRALSAHLDAHPGARVVAPAQVDGDGRLLGTVHHDPTLGRLAADQLLLADWWRYRLLGLGRPRGSAPRQIAWATGAALLFRRQALDAVGGFDDSVFMYGEEWDVQARIRAAGWTVEVLPSVRVRHDKGASATPALGSTRTALVQQSWLHFHARHGGTTRMCVVATLFVLGNLLRGALRGLLARDPARATPFLQAAAAIASPRRLRDLAADVSGAAAFGRTSPAPGAAHDRPVRLLTVDHAEGIGGGQHSLLLLLARLPALGVRVALAGPPGPLSSAATRLGGVRHVPFGLPRLRGGLGGAVRWVLGVVRLARLVRRVGADVVHANTVRAALVAVPAARLARRPVIWHCRDFWLSESAPSRPWPQRVVQRLLVRMSTRTVAISEAVAAHLPQGEGLVVIRNGIDLAATAREVGAADVRDAAAADVRDRLGLDPDARLLLHAGRLRPWKGAHVAIEAVAPLLVDDPSLILVLAGGTPLGEGGTFAAALAQAAAPFGDQVRLVGHVPDLPALAATSELLLATGEPEPFGLVVAQAMAVGTPVVGFDHGALPELLEARSPDPAGVVVPPGETARLRAVVAELLRDDDARGTLSAAARRAAAHLDVDRTAAQVASLVWQVGSRREPARAGEGPDRAGRRRDDQPSTAA